MANFRFYIFYLSKKTGRGVFNIGPMKVGRVWLKISQHSVHITWKGKEGHLRHLLAFGIEEIRSWFGARNSYTKGQVSADTMVAGLYDLSPFSQVAPLKPSL